jgi:hypothetical protein
MARKSICIITFAAVARDARVLRQIQYLSQKFAVTAIGYGEPHASWQDNEHIRWAPLSPPDIEGSDYRLIARLKKRSLLALGRLHAASYESWYWHHSEFQQARTLAISSGCDAFHANDWTALPVAAEAANALNAALIFDAHEYAPLEFENRSLWRLIFSPMITHLLRKYGPQADACTTVAPAIAERYQREFGIQYHVILNAPDNPALPEPAPLDFSNVRLIHHGVALPDRRLEEMIKTIVLCDKRYSLHFMLAGNNSDYVDYLKQTAEKLAPGRVSFHAPTAPEEVVKTVSQYQLGFCFIAPTSYNYLVCLPNKFFDFIAAGLPVCIGPSPSMVQLLEQYKLGCAARSFEPRDIADMLNELTQEQFVALRQGARAAARKLNAACEMGKLVQIYDQVLDEAR